MTTTTAKFGDGNWNTGTQVANNYGSLHIYPAGGRPKSPPTPTSTVPFRRDPDFVDRGDILDRLCEKAFVQGSRSALVGLGGVGKSQLAIEYAYRVRDKSPDTWVFWIHASNATRFEQSFREMAKRARINGSEQPDANIFQLVQDWLLDPKNGHWTLIIDNLDDDSFILQPVASQQAESSSAGQEKSLWDYLPQNLAGSIVLTSRDKNVALKIMEQNEIQFVGPMDESHAVLFIEKKLGTYFQKDEAIELSTALDFMPLAIAQAASYIRQRAPRLSVKHYLEALEGGGHGDFHSLTTDKEVNTRRDKEAQNAIFSTWHLSFDHILQTHRSAADLLSLMSFFDRQGIPDFILHGQGEPDFSTDSEADDSEDEADVDSSDSQFNSTLEDVRDTFEDDILVLRNYSLVSFGKDGKSFEMHRLVQRAMQEWLRIHRQAEKWVEIFLERLYFNFPSGDFSAWPTCQLLFPHVQRLVIKKPQTRQSQLRWSSVLHRTAYYAMSTGKYSISEDLAHLALDIRRDQIGPEKTKTLLTAMLLGSIHLRQGNSKEAGNAFEEILEVKRRELKPDSERTGIISCMEYLAFAYYHQGRWEEAGELARELNTRMLNDRQRTSGAETSDTIVASHNIANLQRSQGQFEEAERLLLQVTDASKRVFGPEHPHTFSAMGSLSSLYRDQKRLEEAEELQLQVVDSFDRVFGPDHPDTLLHMSNLLLIYNDQRYWKKAEDLGGQLISAQKRTLGPEHPDTLSTMSDLASAYYGQKRWKEVEDLGGELIVVRKKVLGPEHPDTLFSMINLASLYQDQKRWKEAEALRREVLNARERALGPDHNDTLLSMGSLASTYCCQERWEEAEKLDARVVDISKRVLGPDHPRTLTAMYNQALNLESIGRVDEAVSLMAECAQLRSEALGPDDPSTKKAIDRLQEWAAEYDSSNRERLGDLGESREEWRERRPRKRDTLKRLFRKG